MNILLIGNGFDLAHELPTTYMDFLFFCFSIKKLIEDNKIEEKIPKNINNYRKWLDNGKEVIFDINIDKYSYIQSFNITTHSIISERNTKVYGEILDDFIIKSFLGIDKDQKLIKEVLYLIFDNFWIWYFLKYNMHSTENWIDFELEISKIIKSIAEQMYENKEIKDSTKILSLYDYIKSENYPKPLGEWFKTGMTYKQLRDKLLMDLNKLIRAFEIYLTEYVEKKTIEVVSPDIEKIKEQGIDCVLSFNYTHTFLKEYIESEESEEKQEVSFDYIHGETGKNENNMVLGIDEYLPDDRKNRDVEFIAFKKFYQRIHKGTGSKYKEWVDKIKGKYMVSLQNESEIMNMMKLAYNKNDAEQMWLWYWISLYNNRNKIDKHNLYIFGHSLDETDKDILKELILTENMYTTIYFRNPDQKGQQIANLVKVIGQDELIKRTGGGSTRTIEFKLQQPMEKKVQNTEEPN